MLHWQVSTSSGAGSSLGTGGMATKLTAAKVGPKRHGIQL
jgi:glutamate 5-kinase